MTMTSERDLMREEFEALCVKRWRGDRDGLLRNPDGTYILGPAQFAWEMFQAGRRAQHSTAEPYLWGLAAEGKSPYLDVADSRKEAETMAEFANRHIDSSGPRYCVVPLYVGAVPRHSTAEPVAEVEQSGMTFEQWYAQYHEDACVMYGGLSGNPKDVAHDAWDAARAIEAAHGIGTKEAEHDD